MPVASRIAAVDFARGLVLVAMTIDHLPGNLLEHFTPRNFALSDSAEAFVFLSGLSIGLVYYRRTLTAGLAPVARSCLKRAGRLYGVHILTTAGALAIFAAAYWLGGFNDALIAPHGRAVVFHEPLRGAIGVALLSHQLGYFNILPLYVALMALAPLVLALARFSPTAALTAALGAYGAVKWLGFDLPNWPEPGGWFFNPLAWQLVFTLGVLSGVRWSEKPPRRSALVQVLCLGLTAAGALIVTDGFGFLPGLRDHAYAALDVGKQNLGAARLVNFLALAYLLATTPLLGALARTAPGQAIQSLGRRSLTVFAVSSLLCALGQAGAGVLTGAVDDRMAHGIEFGYTLASIGALIVLASWMECRISLRGAAQSVSRWLLRRPPQSALAQ
ncbi:MAG: OpgC domain-containing protein [Roseiarcus sp.]|jgi:hypothetical protein|uniref:OpgC family protein n=1 Tax=Roseiarcus sp. TaxID=1969460 RepID=UPI003C187DA8